MYIRIITILLVAGMSSVAVAEPPTQRFFPLQRTTPTENQQAAPKFFPLNQRPPMKLIFKPSKGRTIQQKEMEQHRPAVPNPPPSNESMSQHQALQLLSIYSAVD